MGAARPGRGPAVVGGSGVIVRQPGDGTLLRHCPGLGDAVTSPSQTCASAQVPACHAGAASPSTSILVTWVFCSKLGIAGAGASRQEAVPTQQTFPELSAWWTER